MSAVHFVFILCATTDVLTIRAAQRLPDPSTTPPPGIKAPDPFLAPGISRTRTAVGSGFSQSPREWTPAAARAMAERALSGVESLTRTIAQNQAMIRSLDQEISKLAAERNQLVEMRARAMAEIARGEICSGCNKTRSQIEAMGERFPHPGQMILQESPEQIAVRQRDKAREFDGKLAAVQSRLDQATRAREQKLAENRAAHDQIQEGLNLWRAATTFEQNLLAGRESDAQERERAAVIKLQDQLRKVDAESARELAKKKPDLDMLKSASDWAAIYRQAIQQEKSAGEDRYRDYLQAMQTAQDTKQNEYGRVSDALKNLDEFQQYSMLSLRALPSLSVTAGPVSLHSSPGQLGIGFTFGLPDVSVAGKKIGSSGFKVGYTMNEGATSHESSAFAEAFLKTPLKTVTTGTWGVGYRATYGPDGVTQGFNNQPKTFNKTENKLDLTPLMIDEKQKKPKLPFP